MKIPEHRAAARIAWRQAWRAKGRTALILVLVALPVMGLAAAGFMISTAMPTPEEQATAVLGTADVSVDGDDLTTAEVERLAPGGSRVAGVRSLYSTRVARGSLAIVSIIELSVVADQPPVAPLYALLRGRMPSAAGEAALHPETMRRMRARLGADAVFEDLGLRLKVVGEVVRREGIDQEIVIAAPGTFTSEQGSRATYGQEQPAWLIDLPPGVPVDEAFGAFERKSNIWNVMTRDQVMEQQAKDQAVVAGASFGFAALGLFCTGLIAAAAIGVGARRQLRTLGLVGATGGEPRHVRGIVLWTGTVLGITGSLIGVALAVVVAYAGAPHLDSLVGRHIDAVRIPGWILAGALVLGTIAATVAAIGPARHAARLQTVDALAGRTPAPRPPGSFARRGLVAVVGGALLVGFATAWGEDKLLVIALVPTLGGFLLAIPLLVMWIGRASTYLPTSLRLAARQTGRYGRRTGAAVAAATLALTFPVAVATYSRSDEALANRRAPLAKDQMVLGVQPTGPIIDELPPLPDEVVAAARAAVPGSIVARYRDAVVPIDPGTIKPPPGKPFIQAAVNVEVPPTETDAGLVSYGGALAIGDANLLRAMHAEAGIPVLESGKVVAVGSPVRNAVVRMHFPALDERGEERVVEVPAAEVAGLARKSESIVPPYVISEAAAARYGMLPGVPSNAMLSAPHDLTDEEIAAVRRAISPFPGAYAHSLGDYLYNATAERLVVTAGAAAIALIIVAVAVALVGAESRREHAILVAVGAEPRTRRKMVAANAFLVAALAGVLGAQAGFLPMAVMQFARRGGYPIVVPWFEIGIVALGAPLVAGIVAAVFSREPSNRALLRPVW